MCVRVRVSVCVCECVCECVCVCQHDHFNGFLIPAESTLNTYCLINNHCLTTGTAAYSCSTEPARLVKSAAAALVRREEKKWKESKTKTSPRNGPEKPREANASSTGKSEDKMV